MTKSKLENAEDTATNLLEMGAIDVEGLVPWGSNYTFLVTIRDGSQETQAIYKPSRGERPLWDFPSGTLANREYAAYLVSEVLGWPNIPPTVLREGPLGIGMVQQFIEMVDGQHYFTLRKAHGDDMKRIVAFDAIVNNTDRKGGHVLLGVDGKIWCIDHGVTFHEYPKLRTVIWDYAEQPIPVSIIQDLGVLQTRLTGVNHKEELLSKLISQREMRALRDRTRDLISCGVFPSPSEDWPPVPWPPI